MTIISMYSSVRLNMLLGSISKSSLKSSSVERINVNVETTTIPSEKKAFIYKSGKLMSVMLQFRVYTLLMFRIKMSEFFVVLFFELQLINHRAYNFSKGRYLAALGRSSPNFSAEVGRQGLS